MSSRAALTGLPVSSPSKVRADRLGRGCTAAGGRGSCRDPPANGTELNVLPLASTGAQGLRDGIRGQSCVEPSQPTRPPSSATRPLPLARPLPRLANRNSPSAGAEPVPEPDLRERLSVASVDFFYSRQAHRFYFCFFQVCVFPEKITLTARTPAGRECRFFLQLALRCLTRVFIPY